MKSSDEDYKDLNGVCLIKIDKMIIFQQTPICEQCKTENNQFIDKPFDLQYKHDTERG